MALTDLLGSALRGAALGLAMYVSSCGGPSPSMGCQRDTDCYAPRVCVQGYCEDRNGGGEGESEGNSPGPNGTSGGNTDNLLSNLTGKIVFISDRDTSNQNNYELYSINANGADLRRLTTNSSMDFAPKWSPDGRKIVFVSDRDVKNHREIYTMDADGTNARRLTETVYGTNNGPSWSPDGRKIAFESIGDDLKRLVYFDIYIMDPDGNNVQNITNTPNADEYGPVWSPDGQQLAFESNQNTGFMDIYIMDADGRNQRRLTYDGDNRRESRFPAWFPGSEIVFSSTRDTTDHNLYIMNAEGNNVHRVTSSGNPNYSCWSPDRTKIAYSLGGDGQINIMTADGEEVVELTEGAQPSWTP